MTRVVLVCSNDTHVRMFAPVLEALRVRGAASTLLGLDPFYSNEAGTAARSLGLPYVEPHAEPNDSRFYDRPFHDVWADVLRSRSVLRAMLTELHPETVVVGNDFGLIEKALLEIAGAMGTRRVLVQDGRLAHARPRPLGSVVRISRMLRGVGSRLLTRANLSYLAASEYGDFGVEVICASGPASAELLARRSPIARVVTTGQPRYDSLPVYRRPRSTHALRKVGVFTTPFSAARLGDERQARQLSMVKGMAELLRPHAIDVLVKPHPREDPRGYEDRAAGEVLTAPPAEVLRVVDLALVGSSTIIEEAAVLRCPVIVPGELVHDDGMLALLPPESVYPRFSTLEDGRRLILRLSDPEMRAELAERQWARMADDILFDEANPAAERVADAILGR